MNSNIESNEISLFGQPGAPGIVMGKASLFQRRRPRISSEFIKDENITQHLNRFNQAREIAERELQQLSLGQQDEDAVELIDTQIEIINDPELCSRIETEITENNKAADSAIENVFKEYLALMGQQKSEVLEDRSVDISDIRDRLIQLVNNRNFGTDVENGSILVASELSPREVIEFSERNVKGILMDHGGTTSHAAIIARSMNIPTVVGLQEITDVIDSEQTVILNGKNGKVMVNPCDQTKKDYQHLIEQEEKNQADQETICDEPNKTLDGISFTLRANIEFTEELDSVKRYRAEGIGLLRSESIYLQRKHFGDEQMQESFYQAILKETAPHPVTIRLFDAGGDKFFKKGNDEHNPFLGWRGVRMLLDEEVLLRNQLKALLKAAGKYEGRLKILVPMVSSLEEVLQVKDMISEIQAQLLKAGKPVDKQVQLGIMVEVPSVALQARVYARHVDFLSIGTNDLTQYVLAVDRGNELISQLYNQRHPALWQLIKQVVDAAQESGIPLSVCGELASDPPSACCLIGLGIHELSMVPSVIPAVKRMLCSRSCKDMQQMSSNVLQSETLEDVEQIFNQWKSASN